MLSPKGVIVLSTTAEKGELLISEVRLVQVDKTATVTKIVKVTKNGG